MPSLIYIARIRSLSQELAQSLRSAGCHVESFKSGEITQDECLLAMTPEAADAALHPQHGVAESGRSSTNMPAAGIKQESGRDAAVWDCLKTAIAKEILVDREQPPAPAAPNVEPATSLFARGAKEIGAADSSPVGKVQYARIEPPPIVAASSSAVPKDSETTLPGVERIYRLLRNPLSTVIAVLVFAVAYRGLPSIAALPGRMAGQSTTGLALSVDQPRGTVERVQRRLVPDGVVAQDFTRRVATQAPVARKNLDLKQGQTVAIQKRIVLD